MTGDEQRGRKIILLISVAILLPAALVAITSLVLGDTSTAAMALIRLMIAASMSYLMVRGYSAARTYVAFTLSVGAVLITLGSLLRLLTTPTAFVDLLLGAAYCWAAWTLWKSPHVEAYIDAREAARNPILSIRDGNGV